MEEASLKAQFARENMFNTSEKARFIAKTGIVDNRPCLRLPCNNQNSNQPGQFSFYQDKVFPEEVENIKEYMRDNFTTNVNGYSGRNNNQFNSGSGYYENRSRNNPTLEEDQTGKSYSKGNTSNTSKPESDYENTSGELSSKTKNNPKLNLITPNDTRQNDDSSSMDNKNKNNNSNSSTNKLESTQQNRKINNLRRNKNHETNNTE